MSEMVKLYLHRRHDGSLLRVVDEKDYLEVLSRLNTLREGLEKIKALHQSPDPQWIIAHEALSSNGGSNE